MRVQAWAATTPESDADTPTIAPSDESKRKPGIPKNRRGRTLILGGVVLAVSIILIIFLAWDQSACPAVPIVSNGTSSSIAAGNYVDYPFNVPKLLPPETERPIYGSLTSNGPVIMYVMTALQFSNFTATGTPSSYHYSSGPVTSLSYHSCSGYQYCAPNLPGAPLGQDHLVLRNPGQSSIMVVVDAALVVQSC